MSAIIFSLFASLAAACSSLFFRKNANNSIEHSASGYLVLFYLLSLLLSLFLYPDVWTAPINPVVLAIGALVGLLSSSLMLLTSQALKQGPAGLTFAFQNASAIFPGLLLFFFLGSDFGFSCSTLQFTGMALVLLGLFLGAKKESQNQAKSSSRWLIYALLCFFVQILALTFIQARCVLFDFDLKVFSDFSPKQADDIWFMPGQFGASFLMQSIIFFRKNKKFQKSEIVYGCLGGVANFLSTCLLLFATKVASPAEKSILFPCFAVGSLLLCSVWAKVLYKEKFNLTTNVLCSCGIFMAVI